MTETLTIFPVEGSIVYKIDGTKGTYIEKLITGEHVVSVEFYDTHYYNDEPEVVENITQIWDKVYANAPTTAKEEKIAQLDRDIDTRTQSYYELSAKVTDKRRELLDLEAESKARLSNITQHKALANLELFIQGKITHFLIVASGSYSIMDFDTAIALSESDRGFDRPNAIKLLTLYGRSNGDLEWQINQYSDGSGSSKQVYPCISEEDAKYKAITVWLEKLDKLKREDYNLISIFETAKELGITPTLEVDSWYREAKRTNVSNQVKSTEQQIDTYKHNVTLLKERLVGLYSERDQLA